MRSQLFVAVSLFVLVVAQTTIKVDAGPGGQFVYEPNNVVAELGDTVSFNIVDPIHTVTQAASIGTPCVQSGFTNPDGATTFDIKVNNTDPIYIYCLPHCALGMVMIINPKNPGDVDSFATVAKGGTIPSAPPSPSTSSSTPAPSSLSSTTAGTPAPSSPAPSTSAPVSGPAASGARASTPVNSSPAGTGSDTGAIVGGVIGGMVLLVALVLLAVFLIRRRQSKARKRNSLHVELVKSSELSQNESMIVAGPGPYDPNQHASPRTRSEKERLAIEQAAASRAHHSHYRNDSSSAVPLTEPDVERIAQRLAALVSPQPPKYEA